jgi:hypothetical protein
MTALPKQSKSGFGVIEYDGPRVACCGDHFTRVPPDRTGNWEPFYQQPAARLISRRARPIKEVVGGCPVSVWLLQAAVAGR